MISDTVVIAITASICTALPLVLGQIFSYLNTKKKIEQSSKKINENIEAGAVERTKQIAAVQTSVDSTSKTNARLEAEHEYIVQALSTNTFSPEEMKQFVACKTSDFGGLYGTKS